MQRVVVNRSFTLSQTFYVDGVATDPTPDTATVLITRQSDGSAVTTGSVDTSGTGVATVTVPASANTLLDNLDVTWTATFGGETQTYTDVVEVAGGFLCSLADLRSVFPDATVYPASRLEEIRTTAEVQLEKACGRAFVPRYAYERLQIVGGVLLTKPRPRLIRSIVSRGMALTSDQLFALNLDPAGVVSGSPLSGSVVDGEPVGLSLPDGQALVGYEYGDDDPGGDVSRALLVVAQEVEGLNTTDPRVRSSTADNMSVTYASWGSGDAFASPTANAFVRANSLRLPVA